MSYSSVTTSTSSQFINNRKLQKEQTKVTEVMMLRQDRNVYILLLIVHISNNNGTMAYWLVNSQH